MGRTWVRAATPADSHAVAVLVTELGYPSTADDVAHRLARFDESAGDHVIVAVDEQEVVAVMSLSVVPLLGTSGALARITLLVVTERLRGTGIGRALIGEAERIAASDGCTTIEVSSGRRAERAGAHRFYPSVGYADAEIRLYATIWGARPRSLAAG